MSGVPYTFGTATTSIPLSNLDSNFVTPVTIGNASVALGNTISTIGNLTLNNVTINSGTINASVTESYSLANAVVYSNSSNVGVTSANLTFDGSTLTTLNSAYTGTLTGGTGVVNLGSGQFYKDASGNVLVNSATLPTALNTNFKNIYVKGANNGVVAVSSNDGLASVTLYSGANSSDNPAIAFQNSLRFATATDVGIGGFAERARIDSGGSLLVGTTATVVGEKVSIKSTGTWNTLLQIPNNGNGLIITNASGTASYQAFTFYNNGTTFSQTGYIQVSGTTTTYATSSDYRLKENIAPMQNALNVVSKLKPVTYKWKSNGSDGQGFIAHELAEIVPDCVSGNKDAVDEDGKPVYQGIDTSFLVATLTAAIQEQQVLITQLQADIAELKGVK